MGTEVACVFLSRTGWQDGHFKLGLRSASLVHGTVCAGPAGHAATPHCFTLLAKLKSVKQVKFFFFFFILWPSFLPSFWVTAADLAHVHHLPKHNLSDDSSADVAQTRRTFHQSLQCPVILKHSKPKAFLITEENYGM